MRTLSSYDLRVAVLKATRGSHNSSISSSRRLFPITATASSQEEPVKATRKTAKAPQRKDRVPTVTPLLIPGETNTPTQEFEETLDVEALSRSLKLNVVRPWDPQKDSNARFVILRKPDYRLGDYINDITDMHNKVVAVINDLKDRDNQNRLFTNRHIAQETLAALKSANALLNNTTQLHSVVDKVVANKLNFIRKYNVDGMGKSSSTKLEEGQRVELGGVWYIVKDKNLVPE